MDINSGESSELKLGVKPKKRRSKQSKDKETILDTGGETVSAKERTKKRFEQLLKAALEDAPIKQTVTAAGKQKNTKTKFGPETQEAEHNNVTATELENGTEPVTEKKKTRSGKKKRHKSEGGDKEGLINQAFDLDENLIAVPSTSVSSDMGVHPNVAPKRKKKRKKKEVMAMVPEAKPMEVSNQPAQHEFGSESDGELLGPEQASFEKGGVIASTPIRLPSQSQSPPAVIHPDQRKSQLVVTDDQNDIMCVKIHRVDRLQMNFAIKHPLVRVHVVNSQTGSYLEKKDRERSVTNVYENKNAKVTYILPVMTQPFDLKQKHSMVPIWEEALLFNERFDHFIHPDSNATLFFEILDFLPMAAVQGQYAHLGVNSGWYHVAWAFLKIVGANGILNTNRKVKLQLFCPPKQRIRVEPSVVEVFHWWSSLPRVQYPATLYVTVSKMSPPVHIEPALRSSVPMQEEKGVSSLNDGGYRDQQLNAIRHNSTSSNLSNEVQNTLYPWTRLPGQSCKVPNRRLMCLPTASKGCFSMCFSHCGRLIACGCHDGTLFPIVIYKIISGEFYNRVNGHTALIYEMNFSKSDHHIVSASADGTARVWDINGGDNSTTYIVLPHPSYVYTARFHPGTSQVVATGCYDTVIRIWSILFTDRQAQLLQELEGHRSNVNSLCFDTRGTVMFSGDGKGVIRAWNVTAMIDGTRPVSDWKCHQEIVDSDLKGISISLLETHPIFPRLLVQGQDGTIRMLDSESLQVVRRYDGHLNVREYIRGCISPCGNFLFTGSEDGCCYVWSTITGDQVAVYMDLPCGPTVHCVSFHPHEHLVAFCSYGNGSWPVAVYRYDSNYAQLGGSKVHVQLVDQSAVHSSSATLLSAVVEPLAHSAGPAIDAVHPLVGVGSESIFEKIMHRLDSVLAVSRHEVHSVSVEMPTSSGWGSTFDSLNINPNAPVIQKVVALYDYIARRSDEISFKRGDVIDILCKENNEWWIGKTRSGQCGYVPANHMSPAEIGDTVDKDIGTCEDSSGEDLLKQESKPREVTALLTKSGNLTFISASEDEDDLEASITSKRQRRRHRMNRKLPAEILEHSDA